MMDQLGDEGWELVSAIVDSTDTTVALVVCPFNEIHPMRHLTAALLIAVLPFAVGFAQEKKDDKKPTLAIGDAPPPLTKVTAWLNGTEPKLFEKDKVYVLAFFAFRNTDSLEDIAYLGLLQKANAAKGLVAIGVTKQELKGKSKEQVAEFVKPFGFPVACCDSEENAEAYMKQAEMEYRPWVVVGKDGKIAYIGWAEHLDEVLPKVMDGTWKGKADADALDAQIKEIAELSQQTKSEAKAEKLQAFIKKYPEWANSYEVVALKFEIALHAGKFDDIEPLALELIAISEKKKMTRYAKNVIQMMAIHYRNPEKKHLDLVLLKCLDTAVKFEERDRNFFMYALQTYAKAGEKEKAVAVGKKLINTIQENDENLKASMKALVDKEIEKIGK